jgi:DNA-directed RNA polymerase subunit H (RpoH/RPB5)
MESNAHLPYRIYENLPKFIEYRKLQISNGEVLSSEQFINNITLNGYIIMELEDQTNKDRRYRKLISNINRERKTKTYIILFNVGSTHLNDSKSIENLLRKVPGISDSSSDNNMEIILISKDLFNIHLNKKINKFINLGETDERFVHIFNYEYVSFISERPKHKLVSPQRIISKEEEKEVLEAIYKSNKKDIPMIKKGEPIAVWMGAEVGDIIEALYPSEASGIELKYLITRT